MISIHAPRVGSDLLRYQLYAISTISIHAPRVGSDCNVGPELHRYSNFNPRSPCGERPVQVPVDLSGSLFQSTLPVWGATRDALILGTDLSISIHAPRVGSDRSQRLFFYPLSDFNPRSPCGERPDLRYKPNRISGISIHAPRVGSDFCAQPSCMAALDFNPRSPCGERLIL